MIRTDSVSNEKYSVEKRIRVDEEFLSIRKHVLEEIDMPQEDYKLYLSMAAQNSADTFMKKILWRSYFLGLFWRGWISFLQLNFFQVFRGGIMIDENTKMPILNYPNTIVQIDKG